MAVTAEHIDRDAMLDHLRWITRRWPELGEPCELELRSHGEGKSPQWARFPLTDLDRATEWAADLNKLTGRNVYPVVNPVRPGRGNAASDSDVIAAFYHWADADAQEAIDKLKSWGGPKWRAVVKTGSVPHDRVHVYWELAQPTRDLAAWRETQQAIAAQFSSDAAVINPSRIMRLAGTISWPAERKVARGYVSELATFRRFDDRDVVDGETFARAFGRTPAPATAAQGGVMSFDTGTLPTLDRAAVEARILTDEQWRPHVLSWVASSVARGWADEEIVFYAAAKFTRPGYTAAQTQQDVIPLIAWCRQQEARKGYAAPELPAPAQIERTSGWERASAFEGQIVPARDWHVPDLIPGSQVTMLGGDGGTGKSLLLQQLSVATVLGRDWIGQPVNKPGPVMLISAEDDRDELHRRLADISEAEGAAFSELEDLTFRSLAGEDALLAMLDRKSNCLSPTPLFAELDEMMGDLKPTLLGLDTLSDLHSGEENNRTHARQFIGLIRGLAIRHACAVVLLAHPSLTGISSGSGLSGSTAWNNSVRSRLYFERVKDEDGNEADPDARILSGKKANYARAGAEIRVTWKDGVFVPEAPQAVSGLDRMAASARAERVFRKLLRETLDQGRYVSAQPSPTFAPSVFAGMPGAEGCTKRALVSAMEALFQKGEIVISTHGSSAKSRSHIVFRTETVR